MKLSVITATILILAGCVRIKYTQRYSDVIYNDTTVNDWVKVKAFTQPKPNATSSPASVTNFSDRGQQAFIQGIKELIQSDQKTKLFIESNFKPIKQTSVGGKDYTTFQRRLILGTETLRHIPGERIQSMKISITLKDGVVFKSWDKLETKYEVIDLGKLNSTASSTFGFNASRGDTQTVVDTVVDNISKTNVLAKTITPNISNTRSLTEEVSLGERFINISGFMTASSLTMVREGTKGRNLTGNILTDCAIQLKSPNSNADFSLSLEKIKKDKSYNDLDKVEYKFIPTRILPPKDVYATLEYEYIYRTFQDSTKKYARTISEHDDKIEFRKGKGCFDFKILSKSDFEQTYVVAIGELPLHYKHPVKGLGVIIFDEIDQAREFKALLMNKAQQVPEKISIGGDLEIRKSEDKELKPSDLSKLKVQLR